MLTGKRLPDAQGKVPDLSNFRDQDWYSPGKGDMYYREYPPRDQGLSYDINGNRYCQNVVTYQPTSRDPFGQYANHKPADPLDRHGSLSAYGIDKAHGQYSISATGNKNYNQNVGYGANNWQRDVYGVDNRYDNTTRDRRYGDDMRNPSSPFGRYRNLNNNKNDLSWRDPYQDRRRRRDHDRYLSGQSGDRELPATPYMLRRHSWDAYDESGFVRGEMFILNKFYLVLLRKRPQI